ncbi:hypothetical protein DV515_00018449 [Chloebia gouldiae]|uniref:Solute carrier family 3 member 2 N-terminal domain-containing protein n=1 Tax=Chloebia gouldiae TaxID=44316 RepID=A0A3L8Q7G5_CHLGU|nr:hypothetical protein DV515_00018449 [Chloebia gouldiae]
MKIPPEEEEEAPLGGSGVSGSPKFTGLGKEELLREAGTPLWARARLVLLVLFWGGWIGMLGAAAAIVAQAPRCQPLPTKTWWELGALYRAPPKAFGGDLRGVKVILDLTPNPAGNPVWGDAAKDSEVLQQVQAAMSHWLKEDIAGIFLDGIEELPFSAVAQWRNLTEQQPSPSGVDRVLVGGTRLQDPWRVHRGPGGPQLLLGPFLQPLEPKGDSESPEGAVGSPWEAWVSPSLRLQQLLLLWGLPGTPVLSYGDELGLQRPPKNQQLPPMPWESIEAPKTAGNGSEPPELELCAALASLRAHERSLLLGEAWPVAAGSAVAVLRRWDQSERFLLVLNPHGAPLKPFSVRREPEDPRQPPLPPSATVRYSTGPKEPGEQRLRLEELKVGPYEGVLLGFPYSPQ